MGADGGVCWMRLRDEGLGWEVRSKRAHELINPLGILYTDYGRGVGGNARRGWEQSNEYPSGAVTCTYGSFQNPEHPLNDLRSIISDVTWPDPDPPEWRTFEDIVLDLVTRPIGEWRPMSTLDIRIQETLTWTHPAGQPLWDKRYLLDPLLPMLVTDWARELRHLLDWDNPTNVETWT